MVNVNNHCSPAFERKFLDCFPSIKQSNPGNGRWEIQMETLQSATYHTNKQFLGDLKLTFLYFFWRCVWSKV